MDLRKWAIAATSSVAALVLATATAWACVSGPAVTLSTINAVAGQEVQIAGTNFRQPDPVTVRWNALDGPVVATLDKPGSDRTVAGAFTVPADAKPGNYVVIASQTGADGTLTQMPIRALLTVTPENGATPVLGSSLSPAETDRPVGLVTDDNSIGATSLLLIGLGVGGVGMFVAGIAALLAAKRGGEAEPARVKA